MLGMSNSHTINNIYIKMDICVMAKQLTRIVVHCPHVTSCWEWIALQYLLHIMLSTAQQFGKIKLTTPNNALHEYFVTDDSTIFLV